MQISQVTFHHLILVPCPKYKRKEDSLVKEMGLLTERSLKLKNGASLGTGLSIQGQLKRQGPCSPNLLLLILAPVGIESDPGLYSCLGG